MIDNLAEAKQAINDFASATEVGVKLTDLECTVRFGCLMCLIEEIETLRMLRDAALLTSDPSFRKIKQEIKNGPSV